MAVAAPACERDDRPGERLVGRIPVRNLWLLMLYASDLFRARGCGKVGLEDLDDDLPDLIAEILVHAVEKRLRRNLSRGFQQQEAVLRRVRGRIDVLATERHQLLARGQVACRFEELSIDTPRNRYVRAALIAVAAIAGRRELRERCHRVAATMLRLGVAVGRPLNAVIDADRFGFRDADDRLMVAAARLALDLALPTEDAGSQVLPAPEREIVWVRHLYEKAVAGFYRVVLEPLGWRVCAGRGIEWQIEAKTPGIDAILPAMRTDIVLEQAGSGQRVVIDTKFNCLVRTGWYREEALRSAYIYQIYAYLRSQVGAGDPLADHAAGMLLHPAVGEAFDEIVVIQGHPIRFATVDLSAPAAEIRRRLLSLVPFPLGFDAVTPLGISFLGGSGPST